MILFRLREVISLVYSILLTARGLFPYDRPLQRLVLLFYGILY